MTSFASPASVTRLFRRFRRRLSADQRGNVMMTLGLAIIPLTFAVGFAIDYSHAEQLQTQLNAAADAAALSAVDPAMLCQTSATATAAATSMFQAQANALHGIASFTSGYNPQVSVTPVSATVGCTGTLRTATVTYKAYASNIFSGILGVPTLPITGSATASAAQPPSINFFVTLDISPSMLLPTTSQGIANMKAETNWVQYGQGCTFACHSNNMQQWHNGMFVIDANQNPIYLNASSSPPANQGFYRVSCTSPYNIYDANNNLIGNNTTVSTSLTGCQSANSNPSNPPSNSISLKYLPTGKSNTPANYVTVSVNYPDSWWLAQNYGSVNSGQSQIQLRIDAETLAAKSLITYSYSIEQSYGSLPASLRPIYKMQFFTFNVYNPAALSTAPFGTLTDVASLNPSVGSFPNLGANAPLMYADGYWLSSSQSTGNADTDFQGSLPWFQTNALPATAGTGTQASPQDVLVIVTDGMDDASNGNSGGLNATELATCTAIKNSGTRIAILYTTYDPTTINYTSYATFTNYANNKVPNILGQLQSCASKNPDGSALLVQVSTNGDISAALNQLFLSAVQTARLVQ